MIRIENRRTYRGDGTYIGRPSLLGNPYSVTVHGGQEAIRLYRRWLWDRILERGEVYTELKRLAEMAKQGDLTLICWCAPAEPCHGDIVKRTIEWLNSDEGAAFMDAQVNGAGLSDGTADVTSKRQCDCSGRFSPFYTEMNATMNRSECDRVTFLQESM